MFGASSTFNVFNTLNVITIFFVHTSILVVFFSFFYSRFNRVKIFVTIRLISRYFICKYVLNFSC